MAEALLYNGNTNTGGSVPVDGSSPYAEGATVTVLGNTGNLVKTGHEFIGWNTAADGSGTDYDPADTFLMPATPVTLYAVWGATHAVTYNANGGTGTLADGDSPYLEGETVTVLAPGEDITRTGWTFVEWNTAANGSGTGYDPADTFEMATAAVTLYAIWEEDEDVVNVTTIDVEPGEALTADGFAEFTGSDTLRIDCRGKGRLFVHVWNMGSADETLTFQAGAFIGSLDNPLVISVPGNDDGAEGFTVLSVETNRIEQADGYARCLTSADFNGQIAVFRLL